MKTLYKWLALITLLQTPTLWAADENWLGIKNDKLRSGDVGFDSIPTLIISVTNFLMGLVGTISMLVIIYGAIRMGMGSLSSDKETGKKIIGGGIIGFVIAVSGWFLINLVIDNL
jgi:hypothetical protein